MLIHLCMNYDYFLMTTVELRSWNEDHRVEHIYRKSLLTPGLGHCLCLQFIGHN
jgi:hypothetical protein